MLISFWRKKDGYWYCKTGGPIQEKCGTESPLISEGEYCCACGEALRMLGEDALLEQVKPMATVKEVKALVLPVFEKALEQAPENPEEKDSSIF